ncbi:MAG: TerC/Alx family metal homeostasis membrane protein [Holosporales bacterium]
MTHTFLEWQGFFVLVLGLLALDLLVLHRKAHVIEFKEAVITSIFWVLVAVGFNVYLGLAHGLPKGLEFATAYIVEKALSLDNVFVFAMIFSYFSVPQAYQHRVLFWGVLGAIVMRLAFILMGASLIARFDWLMIVFGLTLIVSGLKMVKPGAQHANIADSKVVRMIKSVLPMAEQYVGERFWVNMDGRWLATPLFLVLICIELSDLVFAIDSVPAVLAITQDPFIAFSSNVFAILGLRALYFVLASMLPKFKYLKPALSVLLVFIGIKMCLSIWFKIPTVISLSVIGVIIGGGIILSLMHKEQPKA